MTDLAPDTDRRPTPAEQIHARILKRAESALDEIRARRHTGRAPDIRTVDNRLAATRQLIDLVTTQLHELHSLGNDRARAAERLNVRQTRTDYSLDTHGDPRARELYRQVALELLDLLEVLTVAAHTMHGWLRKGEIDTTTRRGATAITGDEFFAALAAQARRAERGEGDTPLADQPTHRKATDIDRVQRTLRDLEGVIGKIHPRLTSAERGRLTTSEQMAHRSAIDAHRARQEARRDRTL